MWLSAVVSLVDDRIGPFGKFTDKRKREERLACFRFKIWLLSLNCQSLVACHISIFLRTCSYHANRIMANPTIALPGQVLGPVASNNVGDGTHVYGANLCVSIAGQMITEQPSSKASKAPTLSIRRTTGALLPEVGMAVLGKITRTNPRQATISILALGDGGESVLKEPLPGLIRQQDIRATEIDKVKVTESFRVGDVVRAKVISLGDERSYYLSTAKNELGVVLATSDMDNMMFPVSWREFEDAVTGQRETRKVAKPV